MLCQYNETKEEKGKSKIVMDYEKTNILLADNIRQHINKKDIEHAVSIKDNTSRIGKIAYIVHDAVVLSSLSYYSGGMYYFNGQFYSNVTKEEYGDTIYDLLRTMGVDSGDILFRAKDIIRISTVAVRKKVLIYEPHKICFTNGVFDTKSRFFMPFGTEHHIFGAVDYKYDGSLTDDDAYLWHQFLREVLPDNRQRKLLQEFLGLLFISRQEAKVDSMLFMVGGGSNGKSVIFNTILGLLGRDNVSNYDVSALTSGGERKHNLAVINGKRLNYCPDFGTKAVDDAAFKSLTAGEPQPARKLFADPFTAYDIPFLIGNGNKMPPTRDLTNGFFRRVMILPFNVEIPIEKQNRHLSEQLRDEYPAIFNWIIKGTDRIIKNKFKFTENEISSAAVREYQESSNNLFQWIHDKALRYRGERYDSKKWVRAKYLYDNYTEWCVKFDEQPMNLKGFGVAMRDIGFQRRRFRDGYGYLCFGLPREKFKSGVIQEEYVQVFEGHRPDDEVDL